MADTTILLDFLKEYPLYKRFIFAENVIEGDILDNLKKLMGATFTYYCEKEQADRTFELTLNEEASTFWHRIHFSDSSETFLDEDRFLNFIQHYIGECKSCKKYNVHFLLRASSSAMVPVATPRSSSNIAASSIDRSGSHLSTEKFIPANLTIEKVGLFPHIRSCVDKTIAGYIGRESEIWYNKGLDCINQDFGIGAFAYFRRIIEKTLIEIARELIKLKSVNTEKLNSLLEKNQAQNKEHLIYEGLTPLLPQSLQVLGNNPFQFLYNHTSEGLHIMSEEKCLEHAKTLEMVLNFVIRTIHEEKSKLQEIREAMKSMKE